MSDLIDTTEMYLRTILELEEEGQIPMRARIAERLDQSGPTVSQTVARMERDGLVVVSGDRHLELTQQGRHEAISVMRKHRIAERLLADIIGLEWELVHEEACRWEHVMSDHVEAKILTLLGEPTESPYGNPIPGLEELGRASAEAFGKGVISLDRVTPKDGTPVTGAVRRLGEPLQSDVETLALLRETGVVPGALITSSRPTGALTVHVEIAGDTIVLPQDVAIHIFIAA